MRYTLLLLTLPFIVKTSVANENTDSLLIQKTYTEMNRLFDEGQYDSCLTFFDKKTLSYFSMIEEHALYDSRAELFEMSPVDLMITLTTRQKIRESNFDPVTTKNIALKAILLADNDKIRPKSSISKIEIAGDWAYSILVLGDKETDTDIVFKREEDEWKIYFIHSISQAKNSEDLLLAIYNNSKEQLLGDIAEKLSVSTAELTQPILTK